MLRERLGGQEGERERGRGLSQLDTARGRERMRTEKIKLEWDVRKSPGKKLKNVASECS